MACPRGDDFDVIPGSRRGGTFPHGLASVLQAPRLHSRGPMNHYQLVKTQMIIQYLRGDILRQELRPHFVRYQSRIMIT